MDHPASWWQAQADRVASRPCPKCQAPTAGEYVIDTSGDNTYKTVYRAVVERCRICGWMKILKAQEQNGGLIETDYHRVVPLAAVPMTRSKARPSVKRIRLPGQRSRGRHGIKAS